MAATSSGRRARTAAHTLARYGRRHRRWLALGMLGSVGLVACRLAIPWPLRWVLDAATGAAPSQAAGVRDPVLQAAMLYFLIAIGLGAFELLQRLNLGRFASLLVRDFRSATVQGASGSGLRSDSKGGDLIARVVGDSARLRADLNGILVHASSNGLLFIAVSTVMFLVSPFFGALFLGSGLIVLGIGWTTSRPVERNARKQRKKEGRYAGALLAKLDGSRSEPKPRLRGSGTQREMRGARMMGKASLLSHAILGAAVCLGLLVGVRAVRDGTMASGELFLFSAYALTVHRRMVQVGRQTARFGKVVATTNRLGVLIESGMNSGAERVELGTSLRLHKLRLRAGQPERRAPLRTVDMELEAKSRIAVVGPTGSGKSHLLRLIAGREKARGGEISWAGMPISSRALAKRVGFVPPNLTFPRHRLRDLLDVDTAEEAPKELEDTLRGLGVWSLLTGFPDGLDAEVGSADLSSGEAQALGLARFALSNPCSIWVCDGPLDGLSRRRAERRIETMLKHAEDRTLVVSMSRAVCLDRFDRILMLRRGRITFDGPPADLKPKAA